tara:strand:- start:791 stop:1936 length:1146 start_codon:yes stop_codon:yes gene_type:complete
MKILLPYCDFKINDVNMVGGIENFIKRVYHAYDNLILLDINPLLLECGNDSSSKEFIKKSNDLIKLKALENNVDIIMVNRLKAMFCGANMLNSPIPIIHIDHSTVPMLSVIKWFHRLKENGHSIFLVSPFQKNYFDGFANRISQNLVDFDGFVEPAFLDGNKPKLIENPEFDCVTVGRCCPRTKKPFKLKSMLKDTNFKTLLITNPETQIESQPTANKKYLETRSTNQKYFNRNKHWDNCLFDIPHSEVMRNLSNAKTYFMTWEDETFGITGLEALSRGLPLILNSRMTEDRKPPKRQNYKLPLHASNIIPVNTRHYTNIMLNSKEELISAINKLIDVDRKEIQDMTWEKYTKKRWKTLLDNAIDKAIENFKSSKGGTLPI